MATRMGKCAVVVLAFVGLLAIARDLRGQSAAPLAQGAFTHIGIVVPDLDAATKAFAAAYGVAPPATVRVYDNNGKGIPFPPGVIGNRSAKARIAQLALGTLRVELIEPVGGPTAWSEHLERFGPSVHHVAFAVPDINSTVRGLEALGGRWVLGEGGQNFAYVDMQSRLGFSVEVGRQRAAEPASGAAPANPR